MEKDDETLGEPGRAGRPPTSKTTRPPGPNPKVPKDRKRKIRKRSVEIPKAPKRLAKARPLEAQRVPLSPKIYEMEPDLPHPDHDLCTEMKSLWYNFGSKDQRLSERPARIVGLQQLDLQPNSCQQIGGISVQCREAGPSNARPKRFLGSPISQKKSVFLKKINSLCDPDGEFTSVTRVETASFVSPYIAAYRKKVYRLKSEVDMDLDQNISLPTQSIEGRCRCRTSNCLKLYCECFKSLRACTPECACCDCHNKPDEETHRVKAMKKVLASKYGKTRFQSVSNDGAEPDPVDVSQASNSLAIFRLDDPACQCRKSGCSNKYCGCHSRGRKCGKLCLCIACRNN